MAEKIKIRVKIEEFQYLNGYSIVKIVEKLQEAEIRFTAQGFENIELVRKSGYDNCDEYWFKGMREETDEELAKRLEQEKRTEQWERKQYESLKKKFER